VAASSSEGGVDEVQKTNDKAKNQVMIQKTLTMGSGIRTNPRVGPLSHPWTHFSASNH
jgi:hypothetical protein